MSIWWMQNAQFRSYSTSKIFIRDPFEFRYHHYKSNNNSNSNNNNNTDNQLVSPRTIIRSDGRMEQSIQHWCIADSFWLRAQFPATSTNDRITLEMYICIQVEIRKIYTKSRFVLLYAENRSSRPINGNKRLLFAWRLMVCLFWPLVF